MKKVKALLLSAACLSLTAVSAQEMVHKALPSESPVINEDGTATFILKAAPGMDVVLSGNISAQPVKPEYDAEKQAYIYTTPEPLAPDFYTYKYEINGVPVLDPGNAYNVRDISWFNNYFIIKGDDNALSTLVSDNDVPHGSVMSVWYPSETFGTDRRINLYLPAGYENSDKRYPVLYLLHGSGGDENAWLELGRVSRLMDNMIAQGVADEMIVVIPNGNFDHVAAPGYGPEGEYQPTGSSLGAMKGLYEASFPEIVAFTDKTFRTVPSAEKRALAGLSMGGYHSMTISRENPDMFGYIGLFSAATLNHFPYLKEIYGDVDAKLLKQKDGPLKLYWIAIGKDDFLYDSMTEYRAQLDKLEFPYGYYESEGGHVWANWRDYLNRFARMIFK